jgi:hypothetical protein
LNNTLIVKVVEIIAYRKVYRMKLNKNLILTILSVFLALSGWAQFRKYSNEFLNIGAGARGLAMGGAQVASSQDGTSGYWNPAGLTGIKDHPVLSLMHAEYFAGIGKYDFLSLAIPMTDKKRTLGISILRFGVDDIPNTLFLIEPDGSINYNNIRSFSSADYAFLLSYAQMIRKTETKSLSFGVNAKIIHRNVTPANILRRKAWLRARRSSARTSCALEPATEFTNDNYWSRISRPHYPLVPPQPGGQQRLEMRAHLRLRQPVEDLVQKPVGDESERVLFWNAPRVEVE